MMVDLFPLAYCDRDKSCTKEFLSFLLLKVLSSTPVRLLTLTSFILLRFIKYL